MNQSLTLLYVTSRHEPHLRWFMDSFARQAGKNKVDLIIISPYQPAPGSTLIVQDCFRGVLVRHPKPTVWQGPDRLTKEDWWAKSNALNTGICLCQTEWIAFVDDRSVLGPDWLTSIEQAMRENYAVCGSYEKRANMKVENGVITDHGKLLGEDTRTPGCYPFDSWYGGSGALPLEWCLRVQGFSESLCDGLGSEDSMFGVTLRNSGLPIKYDSRMRLIEDRTPGQIDGALKRADKNPHLGQQAKSWAIVRAFEGKTTSQNEFDIRNMRDRVLAGEPFPPPTGSHFDFYDGQPIAEMT